MKKETTGRDIFFKTKRQIWLKKFHFLLEEYVRDRFQSHDLHK